MISRPTIYFIPLLSYTPRLPPVRQPAEHSVFYLSNGYAMDNLMPVDKLRLTRDGDVFADPGRRGRARRSSLVKPTLNRREGGRSYPKPAVAQAPVSQEIE